MSTKRTVQSVTNAELYDRWSKVYDTDGNILQAIDDLLFPSLLNHALSLLSSSSPSSPEPITVTELGCGTGRNTVKLLTPGLDRDVPITHPPQDQELFEQTRLTRPEIAQIFACDLSPGMLSVATQRCEETLSDLVTSQPSSQSSRTNPNLPAIEFLQFDALSPSPATMDKMRHKADIVISTLVLEHLPLDIFFKTVMEMMGGGGGVLVLSNMHAEMGRRSQAGYLDEETGEKIQGSSFVYEIAEVVRLGREYGFVVEGDVVERGVEESDIDEGGGAEKGGRLGKRGRKWVSCKVWFGCVMRSEG